MGEQAAARSKKREDLRKEVCREKGRRVFLRGLSSAGRAPALQAGGREFESLSLHLQCDKLQIDFMSLMFGRQTPDGVSAHLLGLIAQPVRAHA